MVDRSHGDVAARCITAAYRTVDSGGYVVHVAKDAPPYLDQRLPPRGLRIHRIGGTYDPILCRSARIYNNSPDPYPPWDVRAPGAVTSSPASAPVARPPPRCSLLRVSADRPRHVGCFGKNWVRSGVHEKSF